MLHLSVLVLRCSAGPWDGSNITYGRHHAVTEQLLSPGTNNSVAMSLIKRNGTNYGPILVRAIMYCSALAWPQQPAQTGRGTGFRAAVLQRNTQRDPEPVGSQTRLHLMRSDGTVTAVWQGLN